MDKIEVNNDENPWTTLTNQVVYDNPWIQVTHRDVLNPSGGKGIYGVVHFKNTAIGIVPLDTEGNTWLVGQYRYTLDRYSWEIPEGGGPVGTDPLRSAQRELLEETGIRADRWTLLLETHLSNSVTDEYGVAYLAEDLHFGEAEPEETEQLQLRKLPFSEAVQMVLRGDITDALSIMAILSVAARR
jgi:8-oxo-dGTP pyrophosphatase MutT (NUDIX family)